ncbi:MAG TPA: SusC/RagA family TonB-linked outer membrane protein [Prolixibacteraceae bacterium]|nr:SusC/RagA family TonB-linked outer membrane protein [Prolixibacteraceae bacterium]
MNIIKTIRNTLLLLCLSLSVYAQQVLTGTLKDALTGAPLEGANIFLLNENNRTLSGTIANASGEYRMVIKDKGELTIVYSFIGYKTRQVKYTGQSVVHVTLETDTQILEDAVVVGKKIEKNQLGLTEREIVTSTQKMTTEMIQNVSVTSIEDALQGRLANVDIITGGEPGAKSSIRIRGTSSLNASSEPLIVVDGVPYPTDIADDFNFSTANDEDFGALVNISPNDIESIEVLKDAAATAVWGSKGANGVLLIQTKKGVSGKTRFAFSSKNDVRVEPNTIPMLDASQYVAMIQDAIWNTVNDKGYRNSEDLLALLYDTKEIGYDPTWIYFDEYNQETNWLDEITRVGFSTDNSFSMTGGGERANYRLSLGYFDEAGTTIGTGFNRLSSLLSIKYKFSKQLDITTDISFSNAERESYWSKPRGHALKKMPNMSPYYINDDGTRSGEYFTPQSYFQGTLGEMKSTEIKGGVFNPVAMVNESVNNTTSTNSRFVLNLHYEIIEGLNFYSTTGLDIRKTKNKRFLPQSVIGVTWTDEWFNRSADLLSDNLYLSTDNKLIYDRNFNDVHNIIASAILQTSDNVSSSYKSEVSGNASPSTSDPTAGGNVAGMGSGTSRSRQVGLIGNMHYTLLGRYMFNLGYRYEANSTMGANNRWAGFPSLGVGWQLGDEAFMESLYWLSTLKLRYSWGQSGNAPSGSYSYIGTFSSITPGYIDLPAIEPNTIQLDNLKWETVTQSNFGLDFALFSDKMRFSLDIYDKLTTDMLQKDIGLPSSSGYEKTKYYNSGSMSNKGWEFRIDYDAVRSKEWMVQINFNIARNRNEIIEMPDNLTDYKYDFKNGEYAYKVIEGNPLGSFYGYKYLGVYQNEEETYARDNEGKLISNIRGEPVIMKNGPDKVYPGDAKYLDRNSDGVIDQYDIVYLGNSNPVFTGGGGFTVRYRQFTFSAFAHGRAGQKVVNQMRIDTENMRGTNNQSTAVLKRWRHEGDDTRIPRALYDKGYNYLGSDRFVEDASFIRMKTMTLKYELPKKVLQKVKFNRAEIYVTAYDLFTWTNYTGQDPEVSLSKDDGVAYLIAKDNSDTPKPVRWSLGLTIGF